MANQSSEEHGWTARIIIDAGTVGGIETGFAIELGCGMTKPQAWAAINAA